MTNDEWIKMMRDGIPETGEFEISSYDELHPGRFLKCGHLRGEPRTLTVVRFRGEKMGMKNGKPDVKGIMTFKEIPLQYTTQRTNETLLRAMFGADPAAVVGKRVTFRPGKTRKGGEMVDAIRVAGSPDMEQEEITETVTYAERSMRKPETFTLTKTVLAGARPAKPRGDLEKALSAVGAASPEDRPTIVAALYENFAWSKNERKAIEEALEVRR